MPQVRIVTDSGSDIPPKLAEEMGIDMISQVVIFGEEINRDVELSVDDFWAKAETVHPKTSQPPAGEFDGVFAPAVQAGAEVVCVTITSKHSGTLNSATLAAQRFDGQVKVFDSLSLSWGQRFLVELAANAADQGKSADEIVRMLESARERTKVFIMLDTIEYLKRGGRASKFISIVERVINFFHIKPVLTFKEGELGLLGTANSTKRGILRMQKEVAALGELERLAILHTRSSEAAARFGKSLARTVGWEAEDIPIRETGAVLSSHGGPGVLAVAAMMAE